MLHFAGSGPDRLNPFNREHQAIVLQNEADRLQRQLDPQVTGFLEAQKERNKRDMEQLKPFFDAQEAQLKAAQADVDKANAALPQYHPPPTIDPTDAQNIMFGFLAVALIAGTVGKGGWMRVTQNFNGAMEGLIQGNEERAKMYNEAYKTSFESSMAQLKSQQERFKDIVYATDVPINQILRRAEIQAKIDGSDEKLLLAQQGHIDKLRSSVAAMDRLADNLSIQNARIGEQIDVALLRIGQGRGMQGAGGMNLDYYGKWFVASLAAGGDKSMLVAATSRWASPLRAEVINTMGKEFFDQGMDPSRMLQAQITFAAQKTVQRLGQTREVFMARLQDALVGLEPVVKQAIYEANGLRPKAENTPINALLKEFGAGARTAKIAYANQLAYNMGVEYQTLALMPASNAQMHMGSQDRVDKMVKGDMSLAELDGFIKALNFEIGNNRKAWQNAVDLSMYDVSQLGKEVRPQDFGLPARQQRTPDDIKRQYLGDPTNPAAPAPGQ